MIMNRGKYHNLTKSRDTNVNLEQACRSDFTIGILMDHKIDKYD